MMDRLVALLGQLAVSGLKNVSDEEMKQVVSDAAPDCLPPLKSYEIIIIVGMLKEERLTLRGNFYNRLSLSNSNDFIFIYVYLLSN
jgi:hypothetical protein